ncbi:bifunctional proline dehydrogenase/L-glutamate gamma-semialdehyde dehydrogenase PutA [Erythrobacter sp.]|uniref:bifunctional proline dehydrogenase/L-glutamate gamma-semialdehyde dehydrogenase PutA n=1 Tax=Erythrobacter sp. TaxID=1042 RepID=UPI0025C0C169|nr:bifunctional proline dehydrogenase/L-glutamate gamma-semialdehyde dehydrogenase PutA [Erythrobacter sp.]
MTEPFAPHPFAHFAPPVTGDNDFFRRIAVAHRQDEAAALAPLLQAARLSGMQGETVATTAGDLIARLRKRGQGGGVDSLVSEFSLSSREGVALMCLAEALLRIPDSATRDALIRDKISSGDWRAHLRDERSIFVNATTWGLLISGKLLATARDTSLAAALSGLIARAGEPVIRRGLSIAMELMGAQFVMGETIAQALNRARRQESRGFTYSFDMLGEAAMTMADAETYYDGYERAIHAIGQESAQKGVYRGPGISIKLSALHPRYERAQAGRILTELVPRVQALACIAKHYDIGFNIDAEEADRLELSLVVLETLAMDRDLADWHGLGFVVQAYSKRAYPVLDWLIDLAQRSGHRLMVRLVKGAYWDTEIKRAQVDGLEDFPVFTRKVHTDVSYLACARKLLDARVHVFPQFATHNAQSLAYIFHAAGSGFELGDYEFQCLHGMGEALYGEVVGADGLDRPCRIYAPVGTHDTLLAYLVRRLLENGANSSFVNRIWDPAIAIKDLTGDPVLEAEAIEPLGSPHPFISLPNALYPDRTNSRGIDLADDACLARLSDQLVASGQREWEARPLIPGLQTARRPIPVLNPGNRRDTVGRVEQALPPDVALAMQNAKAAAPLWAATPLAIRAACLDHAAELLDTRMEELMGLIMREAGKSAPNAIAEIREAVDFLRYYSNEARSRLAGAEPLGPVACISPWNFPLAIFVGQVAAALVAGNTVLAKPAEETPLIAAQAVTLLHQAGIPDDVLQLVPGAGDIGAKLVAAPETCGVIFTGSAEVAKLIQRSLARRVLPDGSPVPLIAETGGQNAMVVDSSALPEQVVRDVIASAFDSAGQRCSALRLLCLQDDIADSLIDMLRGALRELRVGPTDELSVDVGPVISEDARSVIAAHIATMRARGHRVEQRELDPPTRRGTYVAPTMIEIDSPVQLGHEVFGPVLHVLRYKRRELRPLMRAINAMGYGLTFGIHSRIDETIAELTEAAEVGNIYVNRNVIGAIVGVQPFGGHGLSGTGPKAGGPLYLGRLVRTTPSYSWGPNDAAGRANVGLTTTLPGPVGERNLYTLRPRGNVLCLPATQEGLEEQLEAIQVTGNRALLPDNAMLREFARSLAEPLCGPINWISQWDSDPSFAHVLIEDCDEPLEPLLRRIASRQGPIPIVQLGGRGRPYRIDWMYEERAVSVDITAAGGNASLMSAV